LHGVERWRRCRPFRDSIAWQARVVRPARLLESRRVVVTLAYSRPPFRDPDNALASCKSLVDALVIGGLIVDDGPGRVTLSIEQVLGERRAVVVEVTLGGGEVGREREETENRSRA
jgi:hypothetical protein